MSILIYNLKIISGSFLMKISEKCNSELHEIRKKKLNYKKLKKLKRETSREIIENNIHSYINFSPSSIITLTQD